MAKLKKRFLGIPLYLSLIVMGLAVLGIIIGSFLDWQISSSISNPTSLFLEYTAPLFTTWLFPLAGVLFYRGFKEKNKGLGIFLLIIGIVYGSYQLGIWLSKQYAVIWPDNPALANGMGYITSTLVSLAETVILFFFIKKDADSSYIIKIAIMIFLVAVLSELVSNFFKGFIVRPRYRNIVTEGSTLTFENFWHIGLWSASGDAVRSCPSGHMIETTLIFVLPLLHPLWRFSFKGGEYVSYGLAFAVVLLIGFTRLYNGAHFLSDICFGVLITFVNLFLSDLFLFRRYEKKTEEAS